MSGESWACDACGGQTLTLLDMGTQPLAEGFALARSYPLCLVRCTTCCLVQLNYAVPPEKVFPPKHPYATGNSVALKRHYATMARVLAAELRAGDVVVDIGANDGTLLGLYPDSRPELVKVAVEPTDQILKCRPGIVRYRNFFTKRIAAEIREEQGPASVVTACNVLAHVPDPHDFLEGVRLMLAPGGKFVTENHDLASVTDGLQFDTVYHEHRRYYSPATLGLLLERHGLHVTEVKQVPTHGGSFRTTAGLYRSGFPQRARSAATALRAILHTLAYTERKKVYGIGAATRAVPLIHFAGIAEYITCVCEVPGSDKVGKKMPGTQIPVRLDSDLINDQPPYALLFSWHMADVIVPRLRADGYKGKFIVPLPEPKVLDD